MSNPSSITGAHAPDWESRSRPSKNNPSAQQSGSNEPADGRSSARRQWWRRKNELVDEWLETAPGKSARPISVREATTLREEATALKSDGEARSKPWSTVLGEFLGWYNDYRNMHLRFRDPKGDLVRAPMSNSHQPQYGDTYYARLKGLEREFLDSASNPHVVMLTLTASNRNGNGGWRCPADHLRDVIESFTGHVRPALHRALGSNGADVNNWEYARVVEHHRSGYGHVHIALFIDGAVSEGHFQPVIDTHLRHCEPAGASAHNYYSPNPNKRPISASRVDADLQPGEYEEVESVVGNLGSYVAEYIGSHGTELFKRDISELAFRATCWATSTNRVDFSNGAQEMISADLDAQNEGKDIEGTAKPDVSDRWASKEEIQEVKSDPEKDISDLSTGQPGWQFDGIGIVDRDGESRHSVENAGVTYVCIDGSEHLDPVKNLPPDRPQPIVVESEITDYN